MTDKTVPVALLAAAATALAACSTATPQTAAQYAPQVVVTGSQPVAAEKAVMANAGQYPNFGRTITAANKQMADSEAAAIEGQMSALTASHSAGAMTDAEYKSRLDELRKLAASHAAEMKARIEN